MNALHPYPGHVQRPMTARPHRPATMTLGQALELEGPTINTCRPGEGPPAAGDPSGGTPRPLALRGASPQSSRNPSVGLAQQLLNIFLERAVRGTPCSSPNAGAAAFVSQGLAQLRAMGQLPLSVDCRFGPATELATKMFQVCVGPPLVPASGIPDGKIGPITWPRLEALGAPAAPPPRPPLPPVPSTSRTFSVTAKSFIRCIGGAIGSTACGSNPLDITAGARLAAFAALTDRGFCEDPTTAAMDKVYRLFSARSFQATCDESGLTVVGGPMVIDTGKEGPLQAPPLIIRSNFLRRLSPTSFDFGWIGLGRPAAVLEPGFQAVCPRLSMFIWHEVRGRISCGPSGPELTAFISGSQFPTHRLWIDGVIRGSIPQGVLSNLWVSFAGEPTRVREIG